MVISSLILFARYSILMGISMILLVSIRQVYSSQIASITIGDPGKLSESPRMIFLALWGALDMC